MLGRQEASPVRDDCLFQREVTTVGPVQVDQQANFVFWFRLTTEPSLRAGDRERRISTVEFRSHCFPSFVWI